MTWLTERANISHRTKINTKRNQKYTVKTTNSIYTVILRPHKIKKYTFGHLEDIIGQTSRNEDFYCKNPLNASSVYACFKAQLPFFKNNQRLYTAFQKVPASGRAG